MRAAAIKAETPRRSHLVSAGVFHFVCIFRRKLRGFPWWKMIIFHALRKVNRFACTKLKLPTNLGRDGDGAFWFEYLGGFTDVTLAHEAIEQRRAELRSQGISDVQFELTEGLPLNGLLPDQTGRYADQEFKGEYIPEFYKERTGPVLCPFKRTSCTPDEVISRSQIEPLLNSCAGVNAAVNQ